MPPNVKENPVTKFMTEIRMSSVKNIEEKRGKRQQGT